MAVFVAASDESGGSTHLSDFQCTGWLAPENDWLRFFGPAWQEHVLDGPPKIPYLHVTEMRSRAWREKHGLTRRDAENRLDEAAGVIASTGSLYPLTVKISGHYFAACSTNTSSWHQRELVKAMNPTTTPSSFMLTRYSAALR